MREIDLSRRIFQIGVQTIVLEGFHQNGIVLDVGGGGEGIIGQILGERVVAIDPAKDELEEAPDGPLKIVMDARELKFLDKTFDAATSFFTFMYIDKQDHQDVFAEVHRVLRDDGEFVIWDVFMPPHPGGAQDIFLVPLEIHLGEKVVSTAYGVLWDKNGQSQDYYVALGENEGFEVIAQEDMGQTFLIRLRKSKTKRTGRTTC